MYWLYCASKPRGGCDGGKLCLVFQQPEGTRCRRQILDRLSSGSLRRESLAKIERTCFTGEKLSLSEIMRNLVIEHWVSHLIKSGDFALDMVYCKASRVSTTLDARGAVSLKTWEDA